MEACHSGDVGTLQSLLTQHPELDINLTTEGGVTLLMHTIIGAGEWTYTYSYTCTPIPDIPVAIVCHLLPVAGTGANPVGLHMEVCQMLVQSGVYLDTADLTYGRTAAHWATYYHREDILTELIIAGVCVCVCVCVRVCACFPVYYAGVCVHVHMCNSYLCVLVSVCEKIK